LQGELLAGLGGELLGQCAVVEVGLGGGGCRVALADARCGDRVRQGHAEVDVIDECLKHGGDARRAVPGGCDTAPTDVAPKRVALVTGSSRGLGRAIVQRLARDGLTVAVNGVSGDAQPVEIARVIRADGGVADAFCADVTDQQQVAELVDAVADRLGSLDVLVLNATARSQKPR
jgi:hypothetical protein